MSDPSEPRLTADACDRCASAEHMNIATDLLGVRGMHFELVLCSECIETMARTIGCKLAWTEDSE